MAPNLILQPLVENAVRHWIAQRAAAGLIEISAWRVSDTLHLQVRDDGPGLRKETASPPGFGLANTRARGCSGFTARPVNAPCTTATA